MAEERYESIRTVNGWKHVGVPPRNAQWQYAQLWHIELVLRHCVWAGLRASRGADWTKAIEGKGRKTAEGDQRHARDRNDYEDDKLIPSLVWFLSPKALVDLLAVCSDLKLLDTCRSSVKKTLEPLWKIRNSWAHFARRFPQRMQKPR